MWNTPHVRAAELPSSNGITDARSLARVYAACIGEVDGVRLLSDETVAKASVVQSCGPDAIILVDSCFGLGFMLPPMLFGNDEALALALSLLEARARSMAASAPASACFNDWPRLPSAPAQARVGAHQSGNCCGTSLTTAARPAKSRHCTNLHENARPRSRIACSRSSHQKVYLGPSTAAGDSRSTRRCVVSSARLADSKHLGAGDVVQSVGAA
jgi:hypothetical protein